MTLHCKIACEWFVANMSACSCPLADGGEEQWDIKPDVSVMCCDTSDTNNLEQWNIKPDVSLLCCDTSATIADHFDAMQGSNSLLEPSVVTTQNLRNLPTFNTSYEGGLCENR